MEGGQTITQTLAIHPIYLQECGIHSTPGNKSHRVEVEEFVVTDVDAQNLGALICESGKRLECQ